MAIPVRTMGAASSTGPSTTSIIPVPAGTAAGDIILADIYVESTVTPVPPDGTWTLKIQVNQTSFRQYQFWKRATAGDTGNYNFDMGGTFWQAGIASRITGAATSGDPYDTGTGAPTSGTTTSATTTALSLTTTGADRLLLHTASNFTGGTWTQPSGWTEDFEGVLECSSIGQATAGATGSITATCSASAENAAILAAILPAGGATSSITQSHYRWGNDDGTETGHTFAAAEDTGITVATGQRRLLRVQLNETGGADDTDAYTLQYKRSDEGADQWRDL